MTKKRVFSGVQPTGSLHLGNYLGAIRNWVGMQEEYDCIYSIVDLHAITLPQDPQRLRESILLTAASYIACGVDPKQSIIFPQSSVVYHAELTWILNSMTPLGWLNRMTQFKEKAGKQKDNAVLGLYGYPVLMAADILLYKTTHVPVGEDQKQHLELARDIAGAFNRAAKKEYFPLPEPLILGEATRVMSLKDGTAKMSKSDPSEMSRIHLTDDADTIARKIKKAKADMDYDTIFYDVAKRPEISNLLTLYASLADKTIKEAEKELKNSSNAQLKEALTEAALDRLVPISQEITGLMKDKKHLKGILKDGAERANDIAEPHAKEIRQMMGFLF